jgi:hypothetical protein
MKWPRCGFRYITMDAPETFRWRKCVKPWGHWLKPGSRHKGPVTITARMKSYHNDPGD